MSNKNQITESPNNNTPATNDVPELTLESKLILAEQTIESMFTMEETVNFTPDMLGERLLGALSRKYHSKFAKFPAEQAAHREMFPLYAENTAMLYILVSAMQEAKEKITSEEREKNIINLATMVNSYSQAEALTEYQAKHNVEIDAEIVALRDRINNPSVYPAILKGVRKNWVTSVDYAYNRAQDNKLRRACKIFDVRLESLA